MRTQHTPPPPTPTHTQAQNNHCISFSLFNLLVSQDNWYNSTRERERGMAYKFSLPVDNACIHKRIITIFFFSSIYWSINIIEITVEKKGEREQIMKNLIIMVNSEPPDG